jgi:hypothetical protein
MATPAPRHLAEPRKRFGLSPLQQVFLVSMLALAAVTAVIGLLTRDTGTGRAGRAGAVTTRAPAAATTGPAARPIRQTPGNLLANGDFERDLAGWAPLGGAGVERVEGGVSGRWAVAVAPGTSGEGSPGLARPGATTSRAGTTYEAIFWVRGPAGGQVELALRERAGGQVVSSEEAGYTLPGAGWQQLAVEHQTRVPGSSLDVELTGLDLPAGGQLLVDGVDLQVE